MSDQFRVWCAQHNAHPDECWELHVLFPESKTLTEEEMALAIAAEHLRLQRMRKKCHRCGEWYEGATPDHTPVCKKPLKKEVENDIG